MREERPLYTLSGTVIHGRANGRTVGMPTANLACPAGAALPPFGVYAARVTAAGKTYLGVTNVGLRPTLTRDEIPTVETLLLDYSGDLYGQEITLRLYHFLRPTRKMGSLREVEAQVERDAREARRLLTPADAETAGE